MSFYMKWSNFTTGGPYNDSQKIDTKSIISILQPVKLKEQKCPKL